MEKQSILIYVCIVFSLVSALRGVYPQQNFIVAKDGSGNFTTISQAISAAPSHSQKITLIRIRAGVYNEYVFVPDDKINLHFVGDGADRTTISGNRSKSTGVPTYKTATVRICGRGFVAKEVTFENTAGVNMNQSAAVTIEELQYLCTQTSTRAVQYHHGTRKIDKTALRHRMQNCTIAAAPDLQPSFNVRTYLGRPWKDYSTTVVMQSFLDDLIVPRGWLEWPGHRLDNVYYAEYSNRGPERTTLSGNRSKSTGGVRTYETVTVRICGRGFVAKEVTFENTAGVNMNQSAAVTIEELQYLCTQTSTRAVQYHHGTRKIDKTALRHRMQNCTIAAAPDLQPSFNVRTYLGRPWKDYSTTVVMQSFLDDLIVPRGWLEWPGDRLGNGYYAEYSNRGPGANTSSRVKWSRKSNGTEAKSFTARAFIEGEKWLASTGIPHYRQSPS
ncbi:putative pectinesterase/pectinesterase inhibitor 7 [Dorcoceras hygrometricum]|uniref:Putative pectinesterase/pectinesterase inhibitor 7 n=1 Tax=Dorcoceras hygrometricum TaxID=472368 RepID=A0A2Z7BKD3_9LAMI|nr:putative pectinesterase/pectinesterase inhibitor 7 [Dorcoceras hygrometricum]